MFDVIKNDREPSSQRLETKRHTAKPCWFCRRLGHKKENCRYKKRIERKKKMEKEKQKENSDQNFKSKTIDQLKETNVGLNSVFSAINNLIITVQQSFNKQLVALQDNVKMWLSLNHSELNTEQQSETHSLDHPEVSNRPVNHEKSHQKIINNKSFPHNSIQGSSRLQKNRTNLAEAMTFAKMNAGERDKSNQSTKNLEGTEEELQKRSDTICKSKKWPKVPLDIFIGPDDILQAVIKHQAHDYVYVVPVGAERGTKIGVDRGKFMTSTEFLEVHEFYEKNCQFRIWRILLEEFFPEILTNLEKETPKRKKCA